MQSGWILNSSGSSTVTTFKSSWQIYMIEWRIQIFTLNVPLPSHGIADYILLVFFAWQTTSKQSMDKVFLFHSSTSRQLHTDIWCHYQINISEYVHLFQCHNQGWIFSNFDTKHKQRKLFQFCPLFMQYKLLKLCDGHFSLAVTWVKLVTPRFWHLYLLIDSRSLLGISHDEHASMRENISHM